MLMPVAEEEKHPTPATEKTKQKPGLEFLYTTDNAAEDLVIHAKWAEQQLADDLEYRIKHLTTGAAMLCCWLLTAAAGPEYYAWSQWFLTSWLGYALLAAWSYCLFYHLCNGIRHLFWDVGLGFELRTTYASGVLMVLASFGLFGLSWGLGLYFYFTG